MSIDALKALGSIDPSRAYDAGAVGQVPATGRGAFADTLREALRDVDSLQTRRDDMVQSMVRGEVTEVHDVMVAAEEAQLAFELMLEIRNRLLESYQEIMRTQV